MNRWARIIGDMKDNIAVSERFVYETCNYQIQHIGDRLNLTRALKDGAKYFIEEEGLQGVENATARFAFRFVYDTPVISLCMYPISELQGHFAMMCRLIAQAIEVYATRLAPYAVAGDRIL